MPEPRRTVDDPAKLTLGQIVSALRPAQFWAVCGAVVGVIGASFTVGLKSQPWLEQKYAAPKQKWLVIHHVEGPLSNFVRVVATVNGIQYAYPADVAYSQIGQTMSDQRLPLPLDSSYTVSFRAEIKPPQGPVVQASSRDTPNFFDNALPVQTQSYRINIVNDQGLKLDQEFLVVTYSFQ
jgi:hypothetical protein